LIFSVMMIVTAIVLKKITCYDTSVSAAMRFQPGIRTG
jgi:hypothetical protein